MLGRDMKDTILIDNSPTSYMLQPECGLPILSWYDDKNDRVLVDYILLLIEMSKIHDIRDVIPKFVRNHSFDMQQAMHICAQQLQRQNTDRSEALRIQHVNQESMKLHHLTVASPSNTGPAETRYRQVESKHETPTNKTGQKPLINTWIQKKSEEQLEESQ